MALIQPARELAFSAGSEHSTAILTGRVLDQLREEGPWFSLGDGETFEDHIHATLTPPGKDRCPVCGEALSIPEENLGRLARSFLMQW